jgi:Arc/MetJ family transcription regulator
MLSGTAVAVNNLRAFAAFRRPLPVTLDDEFVAEAQHEVRMGHIERNRVAIGKALSTYAAAEARLVDEIAARTEELRQVRVSIDALSTAESVLEQGAPKMAAE